MVKNVGAGSNHYFLLVNHMSLGSLPDYLNFNVPIYKIMVILFHPHRIVFKVTVKLLMPNNAMPYSTVRPLIIIIVIVIITMLGDIFPGSFSVIFYLTFLSFFFFFCTRVGLLQGIFIHWCVTPGHQVNRTMTQDSLLLSETIPVLRRGVGS